MIVPKEFQDKWRELNSTGDIQAIATQSGFSYETIRQALSKGSCTDEVFKTIASFYREKEQSIKSLL